MQPACPTRDPTQACGWPIISTRVQMQNDERFSDHTTARTYTHNGMSAAQVRSAWRTNKCPRPKQGTCQTESRRHLAVLGRLRYDGHPGVSRRKARTASVFGQKATISPQEGDTRPGARAPAVHFRSPCPCDRQKVEGASGPVALTKTQETLQA